MMARLSSTLWTFATSLMTHVVASECPVVPCRLALPACRFHCSETVMDAGVQIHGAVDSEIEAILSPEALAFVAALHRRFGTPRRELLHAREERQAAIDSGAELEFLAETRSVR